MREPMRLPLPLWCAVLITLTLSSCTFKATTKQITDTTSNITGTTSGRAWFTEEGQLVPDYKTTAFTALNFENLKEDMAQGRGEYLSSLRSLLNVPVQREGEFFAHAQARYSLAAADDRGPSELLAVLKQEWSVPSDHN